MATRQIFPTACNLMFPGLGHVFLGMYVRGMGLFGAFALLLLITPGRYLIPLLAGYAAWEVYQSGGEPQKAQPFWHFALYSLVGAFGAVCWAGALYALISGSGAQARVTADLASLSKDIMAYQQENGQYPASLEGFGRQMEDPWGSPYVFEPFEEGFELRSLGPDQKKQTKDDLVFIY